MATVVSRGSVEGGAWGGRVGVGLALVPVVAAAATEAAEVATTTETEAASRPEVVTAFTKKPASGLKTVQEESRIDCEKKGYVSLLFLLLVLPIFLSSLLYSYPLPRPRSISPFLLEPVPSRRYAGEKVHGEYSRRKGVEKQTA